MIVGKEESVPIILAVRPVDRWVETRQAFSDFPLVLDFTEVISYELVPHHLPDPAGVTGVIISSARSLEFSPAALDFYKNADFYVVGAETARRLTEKAPWIHLGGVAPTGQALRELLKNRLKSQPSAPRWIYLSGEDVAVDFSSDLSNVERIITYKSLRRSMLEKGVIEKIKRGEFAGILFFSRVTAQHFVDLLQQAEGLDSISVLSALSALCLSQPVLKSVHDLPWARTKVALTPDLAGMVAAASVLFTGVKVNG